MVGAEGTASAASTLLRNPPPSAIVGPANLAHAGPACPVITSPTETLPAVVSPCVAERRLWAVAGNVPVVSALVTAAKLGSPAALPCSTVVVVPKLARTALAWEPAPTTSAFEVSEAAEVTHVGQLS